MVEKPDGDSFLALLDAKIAALQTLRDGYAKALALGALGQPGDDVVMPPPTTQGALYAPVATGNNNPIELPTGAFLNMSIPEAIKLYLSAVKKKQTAREIGAALKEGGMETTAANWETTVTGALHRLKAAGAVLRFKDGWALAEFYPESLRARIAKEDKPRKVRRPKKTIQKTTTQRAMRLREEPQLEEKAS